ncbi:interferon-activable protein 204-like [Onychomys torridus]|uniref:interferon-activable protein 204-like n=1 Tax=Onychomys torridus TaxID=38674 RepID=UPI00167F83D1|nr:interferon-activable protein 204-like [Onychomys torridus]
MFHDTVATETEFFRVKVFDTALKNKFIPQKIITISHYFGANGFLEIYGASWEMEVVVYGQLTSIKCEPDNKLRLFCFELTSREDTWQLKYVRHSYMQVVSARRRGTHP